jgi:protein-S-isoprenylcysteine O-methyltransferase Ste14
MNASSVAGFILLLAAILSLLFREAILATGPVGFSIQILAALLMIWARLTFGIRSFHATANPTAGGLVTHGAYRYIRHPIYAAILLFLWTSVMSRLSVVDVLCGVTATAGTMLRIISEERLLIVRYPEYAEYAVRTKRLLPYIF